MSKGLSLFFATISIIFLSLMSISIAHSLTWVIVWGVLSIVSIGIGFVVKKKYSKRQGRSYEE